MRNHGAIIAHPAMSKLVGPASQMARAVWQTAVVVRANAVRERSSSFRYARRKVTRSRGSVPPDKVFSILSDRSPSIHIEHRL